MSINSLTISPYLFVGMTTAGSTCILSLNTMLLLRFHGGLGADLSPSHPLETRHTCTVSENKFPWQPNYRGWLADFWPPIFQPQWAIVTLLQKGSDTNAEIPQRKWDRWPIMSPRLLRHAKLEAMARSTIRSMDHNNLSGARVIWVSQRKKLRKSRRYLHCRFLQNEINQHAYQALFA